MLKRSRVIGLIAASVVAVVVLSGCSAGGGTGVGSSSSAGDSGSSTLPVPEQTGGGASTGSTSTPTPAPTSTPTNAGSTKDAGIDDPGSYSVVINKARPLHPKSYAAPDLVTVAVPHVHPPMMRKVAAAAVVKMFADFKADTGLAMQSQSAYRSYPSQVTTYNGWVASKGKAGADLTSARPGFSEHQTGLAIDISALPLKCALAACFADTPQGSWLAANAWKYGFVLRYPKGQTDVTGYEFEPWHYRYIGLDLAQQYHDSGATTLEGFFGLPAAPDYLN